MQAYLSRTGSDVERPARWLAGWAVVDAAPGTTTATVTVSRRAFRHRAGGVWATEPGAYELHLGFSVADTPLHATVEVVGEG
ncbi:fibronectin type III-like domain-contianing protein [Pseudonocardia sp. EV170527-09]|uniref:fibronectin type III-like domain-contianing protein n=1 Tax=Pseudonocardia sp. EV170527-09 TaxID=2603411 RepID=UPI0019607A0F|nr:fibronectin type III-like domain-contianing protein [Pseudonocardia sp. EV170527-09]